MKRLIILPALVLALGACNNKKAEREAEIQNATAAAIDSLNDMNERIRIEDSLESVANATVSAPTPAHDPGTAEKRPARKTGTSKSPEKENTPPSPVPAPEPPVTTTTTAPPDNTRTAGTETGKDEPSAPEEKKKKGVNNTVKGAIIGAGAGAVGGAIINKKNPGKGAIIGGVVGAGAGAVTGVILDKNKKKKEAAKDSASTKTTTKEPDSKKTDSDDKP